MVMGVDQVTLAQNMALIIGGLFVLIAGFIGVISLWTGVGVVLGIMRQRRALATWRKASRRADGEMYPPFMESVCQQCHRGHRMVYFVETGEELCPECYERFWRSEKLRASIC
jgi:hypothetical protein